MTRSSSLALGRVLLWVASLLVALALIACGSAPIKSGTYTVKPGDTLYSIAWRNGVDYRELARINSIGRDFAIHPGDVLQLQAAVTQPVKSTAAGSAKSTTRVAPVKWLWPTTNSQFTKTNRPNGGQGLTIQGALGQDIRAAGAGKVVYTGSGMLGYGQLVIIKHNDSYLSAYGHTQSIRVKENDVIKAGQTIGTMGAGPKGAPMLYFEIRLNGRPVDPVALLPR